MSMFMPIREGTRGGKDQFKWEDIRLLPYKDRECYLGATLKLGFLDKGGKWRKKDWWLVKDDKELLNTEKDDLRKREISLMRQKLGLEKVTEEIVLGEAHKKLTQYEMSDMTKPSTREELEMLENIEKAQRIGGVGEIKRLSYNASMNKANLEGDLPQLNRLEGLGNLQTSLYPGVIKSEGKREVGRGQRKLELSTREKEKIYWETKLLEFQREKDLGEGGKGDNKHKHKHHKHKHSEHKHRHQKRNHLEHQEEEVHMPTRKHRKFSDK